MLLAARIPQELFSLILFYVNSIDSSNALVRPVENPRGRTPDDSPIDALKQCSLVCRFWAKNAGMVYSQVEH